MKFKFLTGDVNYLDYGGKWISPKFNNGDFDYWFVITLINWEDSVGEREAKEIGAKYNMCLAVVAPEEFADKAGAMNSMSWEKGWDAMSPEMKVEIIEGYAGGAQVWNGNGNNFKTLFAKAVEEATQAEFLFGFAMDKAQNKIGSTGWDILKGDIMAGLNRYEEAKASGAAVKDERMDLMLKIQKGPHVT